MTTESLVRVPADSQAGGSVALSPFDIANLGRAVPMIWFFETTMDVAAMLAALERTLIAYQVFSGRYNGASPPSAVDATVSVPARPRREAHAAAFCL